MPARGFAVRFSFHSSHANTHHPPPQPLNRSKKGIPEAVDFIFCVGDDRTDEDMFQVLKLLRQVNSPLPSVHPGFIPNPMMVMTTTTMTRRESSRTRTTQTPFIRHHPP